ncbi:MAG: VWA domain-containing protein [Candidatus Tectomicrobia bacterium]|nr:VWA domain-containing protein [Candidatus Tectomicrobia bacterium]
MSWDEALFKLGLRLKRALYRHDPVREAQRACEARLADLQGHLTLVARALSGDPLEIKEAEQSGGFVGEILYLPSGISIAATPLENARAYLYRLAYTVTSRQLGLTLPATDAMTPNFRTFCTLVAVSPTLQVLEAALPMTRTLREQFFPLLLKTRPPCSTLDTVSICLEGFTQVMLGRALSEFGGSPGAQWLHHCIATAASPECRETDQRHLWADLQQCVRQTPSPSVPPVGLWGSLMAAPPDDRHLGPENPGHRANGSFPTGTELPGKPKEHVRHVTLDQRDIDQDVLIHTFEKIETAEEFCGVTRTPDGADELAQHAEALDELDLRDVVRSATPTQSIYKTDLIFDVNVGDVDATHPPPTTAFIYDEWDGKARQYKPAWCTVYASHPPAPTQHDIRVAAASLSKHARIVREVRLLLDKLRSTRILRNRQPEGADIDLDAVVDRYATVASGHQPDDRLYLARRRHHRDLATLVLIDMSYSTDAWIQGERVLDIAKDSALVLGEVLAQWRDRVAMAGFYSHTRRDCRFVTLKSFDASWERSKGAIAGLEPTGYTRIGPALRHGISLLQHERASKKLLILISDGKPTDYDRYEGRYGVADVRQAVREAHQARIHTHALAIDAQAKLYLPQMFGSGQFQILPHPAYLVRGLAEVYSRLSR